MNKNVARGVLAVVFVAFVVGVLAVSAPTVAASRCEVQCHRDYVRCVPFCSKNPCFVACETVLEICLSNCGSES